MLVRNYGDACEAIYPKLQEYLEEQGVNTSHNFKCLNPDHDDSNPSCGLVSNGEAWHCFGCGMSGTIFNAVSSFENMPATGPGFITETLAYLADKYDVPLDHEPPTEEELYELDTYRAYRIASELVVSGKRTDIFEHTVAERGWGEQTCKDLGIGCTINFKSFRESLKKAGFSAGFLDDIDLGKEALFGADRLIFTIRDDSGRPVGFSSRDINHTPEKKGSKYVNTGVKCSIYQKSKRLYGLDLFLSQKARQNVPLYIFEGNADVATAHEHGLWNSCAVGGTALTQDHIQLLKSKNVYDVILCMDGDEPGQKATARLLDTVLSGHKDLKVRVIVIPGEGDPDEFIRVNGVEKFRTLRQHSAFEWRLGQFADDADPAHICQNMIPLIVNESSHIQQEKMCRELATHTGYLLKTILADLHRLQQERDMKKHEDMTGVRDKLISDLKKGTPENIQHLIQQAEGSLYDLAKKYEEDSFSEEAMLSRVIALKDYEESHDGSFMGFHLGDSLHEMEQKLNGNWKKDVWMVIGGKANSGKTSFMCKLMYEIASHEKENDALIIYHTIDDTFEQVMPKLICLAKNDPRFHLNHCMNPNFAKRDSFSGDVEGDRQEGYQKVMELMERGRIIIKDANDGVSIAFADNMIRHYKERYPDRNIVYILDNFHKLSDFRSAKGDERTRFKDLSKTMKNLATKHHICVITTVEYRKTEKGKKASNEDIGETGQIEYDANLIAHVYNELHELGAGATAVHRRDEERLPIIEVAIGKNKITSYKERMYFEFYPSSSMFSQVPEAYVATRKAAEKQTLGEDKEQWKVMFNECATEVREKNQKAGKVFFMLKDRMGLDLDIPEEKQKLFDVYNYCGGKDAAEAAVNG